MRETRSSLGGSFGGLTGVKSQDTEQLVMRFVLTFLLVCDIMGVFMVVMKVLLHGGFIYEEFLL